MVWDNPRPPGIEKQMINNKNRNCPTVSRSGAVSAFPSSMDVSERQLWSHDEVRIVVMFQGNPTTVDM